MTRQESAPARQADGSDHGRTAETEVDDARQTELRSLADRIARQLRDESYSPQMVTGLLRLFEFAGLLLLAVLIHALYVMPDASSFRPGYAVTIVAGSLLGVILLQAADTYQVPALRMPLRTFKRAFVAWSMTVAAMALAAFFLKVGSDFSRVWFGAWYLSGLAFLFVSRQLVAWAIRRWARDGTMERRAVIVGGGELAKRLIRQLEQQPENDIRICGIFDDRDEERSPSIVAGYPKLGNTADLVDFARRARIDMLIIALPITAEARVLHLLKHLWVLPLDIRLAAHANRLRFRPRSYSYVGAVPMLAIFDRPIRDWDSVAKRVFDVAFSLLAIATLWPVMLVTAIAIKATSKGPILFRQKRHGFNNEEVEIYKFRSMYTEMSDPTARLAVTKGDPRVTRVGRIIRKTSIDELPQLFNVLKGQLSLVGPRPHAVMAQTRDRLFVEVVDGYFARHRVKPGVTGWAQINGWRGEIDNDEKIKQRTACDLYYIENWSLFFDLKILFLTPIRLLNTENAY
ncbi:undecaprenyl-phosphate glucose phosphotransferase [Pararhizobium haloflavum]|uniref:undecaprenyl-phosphate glucose phosphotransferase n=1 Tax=Pararhizobium haloflavum TaxID=2037914 RepID=UPI000C18D080|nr:undecaprenyl-phosphate glucose phosphotransferase [Pararhizobium haloflavum]